MNIKAVQSQLKKQYPTSSIIMHPEHEPTEIICEVDPTEKHPTYSNAIGVIDSTEPHSHTTSAEIYYVTKGVLTLYVGNERHILHEGEYSVIQPGQIHRAEGNETWIEVYSEPGWSTDDHHLANIQQEATVSSVYSIRILADEFEPLFKFYNDVLQLPLDNGTEKGPYAIFSYGSTKIMLCSKKHLLTALHMPQQKDFSNTAFITFTVNSVDAMMKKFEKLDITILAPPKNYPDLKVKALFVQDPGGNIIELHERLEN